MTRSLSRQLWFFLMDLIHSNSHMRIGLQEREKQFSKPPCELRLLVL